MFPAPGPAWYRQRAAPCRKSPRSWPHRYRCSRPRSGPAPLAGSGPASAPGAGGIHQRTIGIQNGVLDGVICCASGGTEAASVISARAPAIRSVPSAKPPSTVSVPSARACIMPEQPDSSRHRASRKSGAAPISFGFLSSCSPPCLPAAAGPFLFRTPGLAAGSGKHQNGRRQSDDRRHAQEGQRDAGGWVAPLYSCISKPASTSAAEKG